MTTYLIFTSSNGTTTNDSVALENNRKFRDVGDLRACINSYPAAKPVMIESCWLIFFSPESSRKVFPQKSFAALVRDQSQGTRYRRNLRIQFGSTLGSFKQERRNET